MRSWIGLAIGLIFIAAVVAPAGRTAAQSSEAEQLRRELEDMRRQFDAVKDQYQKSIEGLNERIKKLEAQPAAAPAPAPGVPAPVVTAPAPAGPSVLDLARPRQPFGLYERSGKGALLFDIGVGGRLRGELLGQKVDDANVGTFAGRENRFFPREIELSLFGAIDPYARGEVRIEAAEEFEDGERDARRWAWPRPTSR